MQAVRNGSPYGVSFLLWNPAWLAIFALTLRTTPVQRCSSLLREFASPQQYGVLLIEMKAALALAKISIEVPPTDLVLVPLRLDALVLNEQVSNGGEMDAKALPLFK